MEKTDFGFRVGRQVLPGLAALFILLAGPVAWGQAPAWHQALGTGSASAANTSLAAATALEAGGGLIVVGAFSGQVAFGSTVLTSAGGTDAFVARRDQNTGAWAWAVRAGGAGDDYATSVALSGSSVYMAGVFASSRGARVAGTLLAGAGAFDVFVAKYTTTGSTVADGWAVSGGGTGTDLGVGLAVVGSNVYVSGSFASGTGARFAGTALPGAGNADVFVAKYTDAGPTVVDAWAVSGGGTGPDNGQGLAVAGGSVYVTGLFASGTGARIAGTLLAGAGDADMFVAKYTDAGASATNGWAVSGGGTGPDVGTALAVAGSSVYATGNFASASAAQVAGTALAGAGGLDAFVAKYTDAGPSAANGWAVSGGGSNFDSGTALTVTAGWVYVAGFFSSGAGAQVAGTALAGAGGTDLFVAGYTDAGTSVSNGWATSGGGAGDDFARGLTRQGPSLYVAGDVVPHAVFGPVAVSGPAAVQTYVVGKITGVVNATAAGQRAAVALWPNPARESFRLTLPFVHSAPELGSASLHNALGQVLRTIATPTAETVVDVRGLPAGIYSLRLLVEGAPVTKRIVIE